jgi:hypothetical protein
MPISPPLILIALAALLVLVLLIMALLGAVRSKPSSSPENDPRCGACGCIVANPKDTICPTCRCSIPLVGLVIPFSKQRTSSWTSRQAFRKVTALPLALWTLVITSLAVGGTMAIDQWILPYVWRTTSTVHARPRSNGYQAITLETVEEYRAAGRAQFESPTGSKTARLDFQTDTGSHVLNLDLFAPSFNFTDPAGKLIKHDRLPAQNDLIAFMRSSGIRIDSSATQEASSIATMLSKLAPSETLVISTKDPRFASSLDTIRISFNGGQWKAAFPLTTPSMWISSGLWLFGFILIIWRQRKRRAQLAAALLASPIITQLPIPTDRTDGDAAGGWDITVDAAPPFELQHSPQATANTAALARRFPGPASPTNKPDANAA